MAEVSALMSALLAVRQFLDRDNVLKVTVKTNRRRLVPMPSSRRVGGEQKMISSLSVFCKPR